MAVRIDFPSLTTVAGLLSLVLSGSVRAEAVPPASSEARLVEVVAASVSRCVAVSGGVAGDVAVVNVTNAQAQGQGWGALRSSDASPVFSRPVSQQYSSVNFAAGEPPNPNLAFVRIGSDGRFCYDNGVAGSNVILDLVATIPASGVNAIEPTRVLDTRNDPVPRSFSPGQYLVGSQLPAGRYEMSASSGCYWERQSGVGGTFDEIIANEFRSYDGRIVVDIANSDVAFEFDGDCGAMSTYVGGGARLSTIAPGTHVVGEHILPGTYVSNVQSGCYWERVTDFGGSASSIISNDFVSTPGQQIVSIDESDVGFTTDEDCGTWTRT